MKTLKYAIVTGGTKGIGKQIVKELLAEGYYVYTNYSSDHQSAQLALTEFLSISSLIEVIEANQSRMEIFEGFIRHCIEKSPTIDCIICNTGATIRKSITQITNEDWEWVMRISLDSHFYLIRNCFPKIAPDSRIVFIGSQMGKDPHSVSLPYGVAKSAIHSLALNLVKEFEGTGTTVNTVAPGFVETEWQKNKPDEIRQNIIRKTAVKRFASVEEVADAVRFCLRNAFVNGACIEVNGGYNFK